MARDVRGFPVKFYTKEGNWDLVGNNIPVFFIQGAVRFPDMVHAVKEEPDGAFPQAQFAHDNFRDFISLTPESMHMIVWIIPTAPFPAGSRAACTRSVWSTPSMPENFFAETEQVAFVAPGIDFSNDPLLQDATSPI